MSRWYVIDTRVWEVQAPSEAEAVAIVEAAGGGLATVHHTTEAQPVAPPTPVVALRPALRVLS
jgi:hypothetical protein